MLEVVPEVQPWTTRRFVWFAGQFDTRISTGEDYRTQSLAKMFTMVCGDKPKGAGLACIPSTYHDFDAREHAAQRERGSYLALTGDVDSGNHDLEVIRTGVTEFVTGAAWLIYSSPHSRPSDQRWRIILPLADEQPFETWHDAQIAFYAFMEARGIPMDHALARAAQPVYLPNVPAVHAKSETPLRGPDGKPLYFVREHSGIDKPGLALDAPPIALGIAALRRQRLADEQTRDAIRREAEAKRANSPRGDSASLIDDFNASNSVATMLEICGYEQSAKGDEHWKSPHQTGDTYATKVIGSKWVSLSQSDTDAGLGSKHAQGCYGDAYDLFVHFKHGGDHKSAYRQIGAEKRAAQGNVTYPAAFHNEPPEWMQETPLPDELPDWAEVDDPSSHDLIAPSLDTSETLTVYDAFDFTESEIPVRPWLVPGAVLAGYTHMLAAPGGSGKSLFTLQLAMAMADGEQWGGFKPRKRYRSLVINVEDDIFEQRRRLAAARRVMDCQNNLAGMIHIVDASDSIVVARSGDRSGSIVATPIVDVLRRYIMDNQIDVIFVDPFAETFEGDENDNSQVKWAMRIWRDEIARATGCAVYLVHHTTKYAQNGAGDANIVRGAGAIVNSTRISATLMPMTNEDAAMVGIDPEERHLYVRFDDAKANQSLKTNSARWFRKESVELGNATDDCPADIVGALIPWIPPDAFAGVSAYQINIVLDRVHKGMATGERYSATTKGGTKASGRWVGCLLSDALDMPDAQAKKVISTWLKNGVLVEGEYDCPVQRRKKTGLFAPENSRPGVSI